ncbi:MAG: hypothetical protein Q8Q23_01190 [bacterium]|nr:hypothetical protein [bacterium]
MAKFRARQIKMFLWYDRLSNLDEYLATDKQRSKYYDDGGYF